MAMLGGSQSGGFHVLDRDSTFEEAYMTLWKMLTTYRFDGIDLNIEEPMLQRDINRLIDRLRADFGQAFIITLSPVARALQGKPHLSGFSYLLLERERGNKINFYNAQFYNSWGTLDTPNDYDEIVAAGFGRS
ncbi:glycoside hydrolase superfamily [Aspergillus bertholletiae]|uniref:Glycoside hydrolase superfamily n=1 Tax=Aspergillus bertholletiae TaxID=1226010 RepID=A0A5N7BLR3_9EURO|nr:glycoside hydrolase superfamily [Aspergillus bertholletiae]